MVNTFLRAEWRKLVMANYAVDTRLLTPYLPYKTELDLWNNICYVSLVGFMFQNTRIAGLKIPFHVDFEEINLRFYVRHQQNGVWKRGVVFIKEIVPKRILSIVANTLYNENYVTMPTAHLWQLQKEHWDISYQWGKELKNKLQVLTGKESLPTRAGSEEEFITEHYWGYTRIHSGRTAEYGVEHPRWDIYDTRNYTISVDFAEIYGNNFAILQEERPVSVFLAEGSQVVVKKGIIL